MEKQPDDFETKKIKFLQWLKDNNFKLNPKLELRYSGQARGITVHATAPLKANTLLFQVPPKMILSLESSDIAKKLTKEDIELLDGGGWHSLILTLMYENSKPNSKWRAYLDMLPKTMNTPIFWSEEDLKLLKGTSVESRLGLDEIKKGYDEKISVVIKKHPDLFKDAQFFTFDEYKRMLSLVSAYSFSDEEEGLLAMMPMADMLNHSTDHNSQLFFPGEDEDFDDEEEDHGRGGRRGGRKPPKKKKPEGDPNALKMKTVENVKKGGEIFNTYGELSTGLTLRRYGFVDKEETPYEAVDIYYKSIMDVAKKLSANPELVDEKDLFIRKHRLIAFEEDDDLAVAQGDDKKEPPMPPVEDLVFIVERQNLVINEQREEQIAMLKGKKGKVQVLDDSEEDEEDEDDEDGFDEDMFGDDDDNGIIPADLEFIATIFWSSKEEWEKWKETFLKFESEWDAKAALINQAMASGKHADLASLMESLKLGGSLEGAEKKEEGGAESKSSFSFGVSGATLAGQKPATASPFNFAFGPTGTAPATTPAPASTTNQFNFATATPVFNFAQTPATTPAAPATTTTPAAETTSTTPAFSFNFSPSGGAKTEATPAPATTTTPAPATTTASGFSFNFGNAQNATGSTPGAAPAQNTSPFKFDFSASPQVQAGADKKASKKGGKHHDEDDEDDDVEEVGSHISRRGHGHHHHGHGHGHGHHHHHGPNCDHSDEDDDDEGFVIGDGFDDDDDEFGLPPIEIKDKKGLDNFLVSILDNRLQSFGSTLEADEKTLETEEAKKSTANTNKINALIVRIREQQLIKDASTALKKQQEQKEKPAAPAVEEKKEEKKGGNKKSKKGGK